MTRIGMVCEAPSDQRTATTLASRVLDQTVETVCIDATVDAEPTFSRWKISIGTRKNGRATI